MPAEWESHEGTWLAWPHNVSHWPGKFEPIPLAFAKIARALATGGEKVFILVNDAVMEGTARDAIGDCRGIEFFRFPTNTSWTRDFGPIFVRNERGERVVLDWIFNTWGGKYPPWDLDDAIPQKIAAQFGVPLVQPGIVLEGGSIDVNGKGTVLTTEQCLLHPNRNPSLSRGEIEKYIADYLGGINVLWLKEGIVGDDTDGHIDDIARFVNPTTVLAVEEKNPRDENYALLQKNLEDLHRMKDQDGLPFKIVIIPMPDPVVYRGQRLPASYTNFYMANTAVLVPTFNCDKDAIALAAIAELFPERKVIGIDCSDLIWGLGTIHCSTQQQIAT